MGVKSEAAEVRGEEIFRQKNERNRVISKRKREKMVTCVRFYQNVLFHLCWHQDCAQKKKNTTPRNKFVTKSFITLTDEREGCLLHFETPVKMPCKTYP